MRGSRGGGDWGSGPFWKITKLYAFLGLLVPRQQSVPGNIRPAVITVIEIGT